MLDDKEKKDMKNRLRRIAGQVNGIEKMVDDGRYCIDIIQQLLAAKAAMNRAALIILESHAKSCLITAIKEERGEASINELMEVLKQFNK